MDEEYVMSVSNDVNAEKTEDSTTEVQNSRDEVIEGVITNDLSADGRENERSAEEIRMDIETKELEELVAYVNELSVKHSRKENIRYKNQNIDYTENLKCNKDSSLRKNRAFVRKVKTFTESQLPSLLSEMSTLNIEKYISEIASALIEAKLKLSDIPAVIHLCSNIHENYSEFSKIFFECWQKLLVVKKDEKVTNPSKLRVDLRFYSDLISHGIFAQKDALPLLGNVLTSLISIDKEEHNYSSIILSFCKHCGDDYAGLVPRRIRELSEKHGIEIPRSKILPPEKQKTVKSLLVDYYNSLCCSLSKEHKELRAYEKQNKQILQTKGELSNDRKEKLEVMQTSLHKLQSVAQNFAEILDEDVPMLHCEKENKVADEVALTDDGVDLNDGCSSNIWDDEETQRFYEEMPDVREFLPQNKKETTDGKESVEAVTIAQVEDVTEEKLDEEFNNDNDDNNDAAVNVANVAAVASSSSASSSAVAVVEEEKSVEVDNIEDDGGMNANAKTQLETFLNHLPNCINKEMIDNAAIEFLMTHNNKNYRKKLVKALFNVPRTRLDLLPLYSRLVAILYPVMPDVANDLVQSLKNDFKFHVRKKDQINIETKIKVIRFIGELVKFQMYSKYEGLHCLKVLLNDFTHHHIEMACNLLECAGRFFYRHSDTRQRTKVYLEQMMRKKCVMNLDSRYVTMIENAYYYVNPPESVSQPIVKLPVLHQFLRKILYQDLTANDDVETKVLNLMRKLDWKDKRTSDFAIKCLTHAWNVKYQNIRCLANLLAGLVEYQEFVGTRVVDGVLEDIRLGLELNMARMNQRRIAMIKYLGELYNYRMVESNDVFKCLYTLISFGVSNDRELVSALDPPANTFRIRLVCVLLETCGQYFNHGLSKTKLDYFFVYFQHYYWFKYSHPIWTSTENSFPIQIKYMVRDILTGLRPQVKLSKTYEEAKEALNELQTKLLAKLQPLANATKKQIQGQLSTILENEDEIIKNKRRYSNDNADHCQLSENNRGEDNDDNDNDNDDDNNDENENENEDEDEDEDEDEGDDNDDDDDDDENERETKEFDYETENSYDKVDYHESIRERRMDQEDEAFADAFDKMVSEDIQDRLRETIRPQQIDISVPYNVRNTLKKNYEQLNAPNDTDKSSVNFVVLLRKGNKQQYKNLEIPLDSDLAKNLKSQEKAEQVEMERVKRLTLDINERLEEEDYQDQIQAYTQKQLPTVTARDKKKKYQHQKGVPDADLIFGKKKFQYK